MIYFSGFRLSYLEKLTRNINMIYRISFVLKQIFLAIAVAIPILIPYVQYFYFFNFDFHFINVKFVNLRLLKITYLLRFENCVVCDNILHFHMFGAKYIRTGFTFNKVVILKHSLNQIIHV